MDLLLSPASKVLDNWFEVVLPASVSLLLRICVCFSICLNEVQVYSLIALVFSFLV